MTAPEIAALGKKMRSAQKAFHKKQRAGLNAADELAESVRLEGQFDRACRAVLGDRGPGLFDGLPREDQS